MFTFNSIHYEESLAVLRNVIGEPFAVHTKVAWPNPVKVSRYLVRFALDAIHNHRSLTGARDHVSVARRVGADLNSTTAIIAKFTQHLLSKMDLFFLGYYWPFRHGQTDRDDESSRQDYCFHNHNLLPARFNNRLLVTTLTELNAIAAAANMGVSTPNIASGIMTML